MTKQFVDVSTHYGAPMGRSADGYLETQMLRSVRLFKVNLDSGGYDDGGAYWGLGEPLWCAIDIDGCRQFTRAMTRARAAFILDIGSKALIRPLNGDGIEYGLALLDGKAPMPRGKYRHDVIEWLQWCGASRGQLHS